MLRSIALALAIVITPVAAQAQVAPAEQAAIDLALARGRLIYAYDQAAWHGTDDMRKKLKNPEKTVSAWIVDGPADAPTLIFFDQNKADPHAVYIASFRGNKLVSSRVLGPHDDNSLSPERKAMIAARDTGVAAWREAKPVYCAATQPNTVVLPPERPGGPFLVYVMTPQSENGAYPLGGHFRIEIGADGKPGASRSFTRSCLTISGAGDRKAASMFVTHLLDPVPTEIHVFTALTAHMPVAVGTMDKRIWWVTGEAIEARKLE